MNAMTAAHRSLPLNCYIRVTNKDNGKSVIVKVNDRGPFNGNRVLDLSYGAAQAIGITQRGTGNVIIERVDGP
jgi:rare lipoprotein A